MDYFKGRIARFMVEIFKVVYMGKDEVEPDDQLGTIIIKNRKYHQYIYEVDDAYKCKSTIKPGDQLTLSGPTLSSIKCPSGYLIIEVDLFFGAFRDSVYVSWLPSYNNELCNYGVKRIRSRYDEEGEILIYYGMYYRATEALVEVSLLTTDNSVIDCSGSISACPIQDNETENTSLLFLGEKVKSGEPIPLSRSIVAVPMGSKLSVKFHLYSDDRSVMADDSLDFVAKLDEKEKKTFYGTKCQICVEVNWNSKYHSKGELNDIYDCREE